MGEAFSRTVPVFQRALVRLRRLGGGLCSETFRCGLISAPPLLLRLGEAAVGDPCAVFTASPGAIATFRLRSMEIGTVLEDALPIHNPRSWTTVPGAIATFRYRTVPKTAYRYFVDR